MHRFDLYPAIDLRDGRCVRLYQGDYGQETVYGDDPVAQARAFAAAGAPWVHVVDLDAARTGDPRNRAIVAAIAAAVDVPVQTGGGVRDDAAADALLAAGVRRVVVGTAGAGGPRVGPAPRRPASRPGGGRARRPWPRRRRARVGRGVGQRPPRRGPRVRRRRRRRAGRDRDRARRHARGPRPRPALGRAGGHEPRRASPRAAWGRSSTCGRSPRSTSAGGASAGVIVGKALYEGAFAVTDAVEAGSCVASASSRASTSTPAGW